MQLDKTALDRLLSLDDVTLAKTISALSASAGIDRAAVDSAVSNLRLVRAALSNASDKDISSALTMIANGQGAKVLENLSGDKNGGK